MDFKFPVFVRVRDSREVCEFASAAAMQRELEKIDIENNEHEAWDADGRNVVMSVAPDGREWLRIDMCGREPRPEELAEAIREFARRQKVQIDVSGLSRGEFPGTLKEVWSAARRRRAAESPLRRFSRRF